MNRKKILTRDAKRVRALIGGVLFPAPWLTEKLLWIWWLGMERDLEKPESKTLFQVWRGEMAQRRVSWIVFVLSFVLGVSGLLVWWEVFLPVASAANKPQVGAWLAFWSVCLIGHAFATLFGELGSATSTFAKNLFPEHKAGDGEE